MPRKMRSKGPRSDRADDYDVGYGKAPERGRFKPGVSGNPKGRPRRDRDGQLNDMLEKELYRPIRIKQNDVITRVTAIEASMRSLMISAAKGEPAAVMAALKIAANLELDRQTKRAKNPPMSAEERLRRMIEILTRASIKERKKLNAAISKGPKLLKLN